MNISHISFLIFFYREEFYNYAKLFDHFAILCSELLSRRDIMDSLIHQNFDLLFLDSTDPCVFLIAEKLWALSFSNSSPDFVAMNF